MKPIFKDITFAILSVALASSYLTLVSCGKEEAKRKTVSSSVKMETPEEFRARMEREQKEAEEKAAREAAEKSQFLSIDFRGDNLKKGDVLTALVDIKSKFDNPFDANDIYVDAYIFDDAAGISMNVPLAFMGGKSGNSSWQLKAVIPSAGSYKCLFGVRQKRDYETSREYKFNVADVEGGEVYRLDLKGKDVFFFKSDSGHKVRAVGASIAHDFTLAEKKNLLNEIKKSGANTVRLDLDFITNFVLPSDSGSFKAGWPNMKAMSETEEILKDAAELGIKVIICFDSAEEFTSEAYSKTYFSKIAASPSEFFMSPAAQEAYRNAVGYFMGRFDSDESIIAWQIFSGIDAWEPDQVDTRYYSISSIGSFIRDRDKLGRAITISIRGSSDFDFLWRGDFADLISFELFNVQDFADSVMFHSEYFSRKYKKGVCILKSGVLDGSDLSGVGLHNAIWSSLFSRTPIVALADLDKNARAQVFSNLKSASEFNSKYVVPMKKPEVMRLPTVNVIPSIKNKDDVMFIRPAFGLTQLNKESSTDLAVLEISADRTVAKNTLPSVWRSNAIITLKFDAMPKDCFLHFKIPSILRNGNDACRVSVTNSDGDEVFLETFDPQKSPNSSKAPNGDELAVVNKSVRLEIPEGKSKFDVMITSPNGTGYINVSDMKITGIGSKLGFNDVKVVGLTDVEGDTSLLWFRRGGYNNWTYTKYKIHNRKISPVRSFEYKIPVGSPRTKYTVVWWDTREAKEIAKGELFSDAKSILKFRTPAINSDVAAAIYPSAVPAKPAASTKSAVASPKAGAPATGKPASATGKPAAAGKSAPATKPSNS